MDSWPWNCLEADMVDLQHRGLNLELDLNYPIPSSLDLSLGLSFYSDSWEVQSQVHRWPQQHISNAIQALDEDVSIISPQDFAQARENSERNHIRGRGKRELVGQATGIPEGCDAAASLCSNCKRRMPDDCQPCKPGPSSKKKAENVSVIQELSHLASVSEEPLFSCPVCMGPLTEPTSTKCGHIFCKECLLKSLKSLHNKCPTCRQKVGKRAIFRVYLPTTY
ncbi:E3 ubiquitin-protein ligase BRE1-like 1 [Euphorbia peplus]|nr:E3 ubiquitin-protein ligase BRE1-like 1 [Euphorbia peplus]